MTPHCCHIDQITDQSCTNEAELQIQTLRRSDNGDGIMAGPDPYLDDTQACMEHVGYLLGTQPECHNIREIYWVVCPISETWLSPENTSIDHHTI